MTAPPHASADDLHSSVGFEEMFLEKQLCLALYMATNHLTRIYSLILAKFDLTLPQVLTLMALWEIPRQTVGDLGHALGLDSGTMSPILKRLEANGYVVRSRDTADERRVYVQVTRTGLDLRQTILQLRRDVLCALDMPAEDVETARLTLSRMIQKMSEMRTPKGHQRQQRPRQRQAAQTANAAPLSVRPALIRRTEESSGDPGHRRRQ